MRRLKPNRDEVIEGDIEAMRRYARSLARNSENADDVVQEALVRAIERRQTFEPGRNRRRWLLSIVHNVFVSRKRREAVEARHNDSFAESMMARLDAEQGRHVKLAQIASAFAALSEQHRAVLHLIAVEELSYQEAADILDLPIGTVMSRLSRARASLRALESKEAGEMKSLRVVGGMDD
jgi:RNA polymerase sigma factor (sigma-70 family)